MKVNDSTNHHCKLNERTEYDSTKSIKIMDVGAKPPVHKILTNDFFREVNFSKVFNLLI